MLFPPEKLKFAYYLFRTPKLTALFRAAAFYQRLSA
jgi:hypothetical protein